jgi:hypothetical protein
MRFRLRLAVVGFTLFALGVGLLISEFRIETPLTSATSTGAPTTAPRPSREPNSESKRPATRPAAPVRRDDHLVASAGQPARLAVIEASD